MPSTPKMGERKLSTGSTTSNDGLAGLIESVFSWHSEAVEATGMTPTERQNSKERLFTASLSLMRRNSKDGLHKIWDAL